MRKLSIAIACIAATLVAGCGVPSDNEPRTLDPKAAPFRSISPRVSPSSGGATRALVYLTNANVLVAVPRGVAAPTAEAVLASLLAGPVAREREAGLGTAVPPGAEVDEPVTARGVLRITLPTIDSASSGRTDEILGLAQLVVTLTSLPEVRSVQFFRDGKTLAVPRADGSLTLGPVTRADYAQLL